MTGPFDADDVSPVPLDAGGVPQLPPARRPVASRRALLIAAGAVVVAVGGAAAGHAWWPSSGGPATAAGAPATPSPSAAGSAEASVPPTAGPSPSAVPVTPADVQRLQVGLAAQSPEAVAAVLSSALRQSLVDARQVVLPPGSTLAIDAATVTYSSPTTGSVDGTVSGPQPGRYRLLLGLEDGQWCVYATERLA